MRAPLAVGLALAAALAAVYYVNVSAQASDVVINAAGLRPGQNATFTFGYVPRVIKFVGLNEGYYYEVEIYIPGADFTTSVTAPTRTGEGAAVFHERAAVWINTSLDTVAISVVRAPPGRPSATVTVRVYG